MFEIVSFGELLIDFTPVGLSENGNPIFERNPGGGPANMACAAAKLGAKTAFMGKVGDDIFGRALQKVLEGQNVDARGLLLSKDDKTTLAFVQLDETGDRSFSFYRKYAADTMVRFEELDLSLIDGAKVFHFGSLSLTGEPARTATRRAVEYAKKQGKLISYDPNLRKPLWPDLEEAREQLLWGLSQADVVKISDEEVDFLFGLAPEEGADRIFERFGAKLVFVTCGGDGCVYKNANAKGHVAALKNITVADTTGAGDIFGGSAMWKLLEMGKAPGSLSAGELETIVGFACASAGLSATRPGGISSVPGLEEVLRCWNNME